MKTYEKVYRILSQESTYISGEKLAQTLQISRTSIWKAIKQLEAHGLVIHSVKNLGYRIEKGDLLLPYQLADELPFFVSYNEKSLSTQTDARHGIELGHPANSLYLAPSQSAAKGRFARDFFAPSHGGIYMSLHLAPHAHFDQVPPYTLLVGASIIKAIHNLTGKTAQIKWVNDIYWQNKKIAGILTEAISSVETGLVTDVIIGVAINFHIEDFPDYLREKAGSLFTEQPSITRNQLITEIWSVFLNTPKEDLLSTYRNHSLVLGKEVSFTQERTRYQGKALEIDTQGRLLVHLKDGKQIWLNSGEISLTGWE